MAHSEKGIGKTNEVCHLCLFLIFINFLHEVRRSSYHRLYMVPVLQNVDQNAYKILLSHKEYLWSS